MSDPREPEDANSAWARPEQPSPDATSAPPSYEPQQQAGQPDWPTEQQWQPQAPQQNWPPQQDWPPQESWQAGPYEQGQPYPQQWQPQPGQQYYPGQPYGAGPAQAPVYGEVPPMSTATAKRSRAPLYIALAALVVIVGGAAVYFFAGRSTLDQQAAETGVAQVLAESYGLENVTAVSCPSGQQVKKDDSFTCTVTVNGESRDVTITFVDDDGTYEVGRPS